MYKSHINKRLADSIVLLYRQSARWGAASLQDDSPLIKLLHANYAAGYLWSIKDMVSSDEFQKITGDNLKLFEMKIINMQDSATKSIADTCKDLIFVKDPMILNAMYNQGDKI
jgi:hypothetical protein